MSDAIMVTILTPTYNRAKTLPKLIESLCGQTSTNFQWLVIDDGSTDDTDSIFEELKKYDDYDNRTIKIVLKKSYDEQTRVKYDISTGDCWYIY